VNTLADFLSTCAPGLPPVFIPAATVDGWSRLTRHLPRTDVGFECRLGPHAGPVDLSLSLRRGDGRCARVLAALATAPSVWQVPGWRHIADFCRAWESDSALGSALEQVWLEFDEQDLTLDCPLPRVFFSTEGLAAGSNPLAGPAGRILHLLGGAPPATTLAADVRAWCAPLPAHAAVYSMGTAVSGPVQRVRLAVSGLTPETALAFAAARGWPAPPPALLPLLRSIWQLAEFVVTGDAGDVAQTKTGFYVIPGRHCNRDRAVVEPLFAALHAANLATSEQCAAAGHWPHEEAEHQPHDWIAPQDYFAAWLSGREVQLLVRRIVHAVKVEWQADGRITAKGYFGFRHRFAVPASAPPTFTPPFPNGCGKQKRFE